MKKNKKIKLDTIFRMTALALTWAVLFLDFAWAGILKLSDNPKRELASALSPAIKLDSNTLRQVFVSLPDAQNEIKPEEAKLNFSVPRNTQVIMVHTDDHHDPNFDTPFSGKNTQMANQQLADMFPNPPIMFISGRVTKGRAENYVKIKNAKIISPRTTFIMERDNYKIEEQFTTNSLILSGGAWGECHLIAFRVILAKALSECRQPPQIILPKDAIYAVESLDVDYWRSSPLTEDGRLFNKHLSKYYAVLRELAQEYEVWEIYGGKEKIVGRRGNKPKVKVFFVSSAEIIEQAREKDSFNLGAENPGLNSKLAGADLVKLKGLFEDIKSLIESVRVFGLRGSEHIIKNEDRSYIKALLESGQPIDVSAASETSQNLRRIFEEGRQRLIKLRRMHPALDGKEDSRKILDTLDGSLEQAQLLALPAWARRVLDNELIKIFFERDKKGIRTLLYPRIIKELFDSEGKIVKKVIAEVEQNGEKWIERKGREMLVSFGKEFDPEKFKITDDWAEFIRIETSGRYDLTQLFSYNLGVAYSYFQLMKADKGLDDEDSRRRMKNYRKAFENGYIILCAIEIASRKNAVEEKTKEVMPETTDVGLKIKQIKELYEEEITIADAYPGFTRTIDDKGRDLGIFLVSDIDDVNKIIDILPINSDTKVCDLGSGIGNVCCLFAIRGVEKVVGYEIDRKLVELSDWIAKKKLAKIINKNNIEFKRKNFLEEDLTDFDIIFYWWNGLLSDYLPEFKEKLIKELKPGALLVVFGTDEKKEYFPGLKEATYLGGYQGIKSFTKIYTKPIKNNERESQKEKTEDAVPVTTRQNLPRLRLVEQAI